MSTISTSLSHFILDICKRYKKAIAGLIGVSLFRSMYLSFSPYIGKCIIDKAASLNASSCTYSDIFQELSPLCVLYIFSGVFIAGVYRCYDWITLKTYPAIKNDITTQMFIYLEGHSYTYFQERFGGNLANKIGDMSKGISRLIGIVIETFISTALSFIIGAILLITVHPVFSFLFLGWVLIFGLFSYFLSKRAQHYSKIFSEARSVVSGKLVDSVSNILSIKLFAREQFENRYLQSYLHDCTAKDRALQWYLLKMKTWYSVWTACLVAAVMWCLMYEYAQKAITIGDFAFVFGLMGSLIDEAFTFSTLLMPFSEEVGSCQQSLHTISSPQEIVDIPDAIPLHITKGEIVFDRVHFKYKKGTPIFTDKSVTIAAGEKVGLVGFSGSGKSTFINLILRFFDVDSGRILIDGQDIKTVTQESLRSHIAIIPQDPALFHRTLMENIRYGNLDAPDEDIIAYSKRAHCDEFICRMKEGYQSLVGERGIKLSGGQRQRIAIARAMVKNAPILILDEATSALDSITESYIQESLLDLMKEKTTLVIAHRLSTLFNMDRILVFDNGKIVEEGSHKELISCPNGRYAKLWNMQAGGFIGGNVSPVV